MRGIAVIPAYQAAHSVGSVVRDLLQLWPRTGDLPAVLVVDDGSTDRTATVAEAAGASVIRLSNNRGKGAALRAGLGRVRELGADVAVTLDADGQHLAEEALRILNGSEDPETLVLGVRDLAEAGAPAANRFSNAFSNFFVSQFGGLPFRDTQCGLRRYPVEASLGLGARSSGFGFESEVLVRAARAGWRIAEVPVRVEYPPETERASHFRVVRDPTRIVIRLLFTTVTTPRRKANP